MMKYEHKEMEVSVLALGLLFSFFNFILHENWSAENTKLLQVLSGSFKA